MVVTLDEKINSRLQLWCKHTQLPPEVFINHSLEQALDDWEDYNDALRICAEIDRGEMQTFSLHEVEEHLDALEG